MNHMKRYERHLKQLQANFLDIYSQMLETALADKGTFQLEDGTEHLIGETKALKEACDNLEQATQYIENAILLCVTRGQQPN